VFRITTNTFLFGFVLVMVVEFIRMAPHTRLEKTQPPPTMDGIVLVMVDGLVRGATNEPMAFMLKDQVEPSVGSWKILLQFEHL
jgi:hypothetical protein